MVTLSRKPVRVPSSLQSCLGPGISQYLYLYLLYACTYIAIPFLTKLWQTVFQVVFVSQKISVNRYRHPNVFVIGDDRYILEVLGDISYRISLLNKKT